MYILLYYRKENQLYGERRSELRRLRKRVLRPGTANSNSKTTAGAEMDEVGAEENLSAQFFRDLLALLELLEGFIGNHEVGITGRHNVMSIR